MASFVARDDEQIVFDTIGDERAPGLLLALHGSAFAGAPLYAFILYGARNPSAWPILVLFVPVGVAVLGHGLRLLLKSEWLVIDLRGRSHAGCRGGLFWGERWVGLLGDFDHIRLCDIPCGHRGRHRRWIVEWVWTNQERRPFRVSGWGRPESFRIAPRRRLGDDIEFLRELRGIAEDVGLPLLVPRRFLDGLGVEDSDLDLAPNPRGH